MNSWGQAAYVAAGKQVHVNIDPAGVASDVCNAALARKEKYAQELLGIAQRERISGFITDWEDATGNNMTCFNALWGYVSSVLCAATPLPTSRHACIAGRVACAALCARLALNS